MLSQLFPGSPIQINASSTQKPSQADHLDQPETSSQNGFIRHPSSFPVNLKPVHNKLKSDVPSNGGIGILIELEKKLPIGSEFLISIPLRNEEYTYHGKLVFLRELEHGYEAGLWLYYQKDLEQIRIIEQICHIESYLDKKKQTEGPEISKDNVAADWISRFSENFPQLQ